MQYANNRTTAFESQNVAVGYSALRGSLTPANNTGNANTAVGYLAMLSNTTGLENTANGQLALRSNTTGSNNTAIGAASLNSNTTGYENMANGYISLYWNTTGYNNTASGTRALYQNTTGNNNTALGNSALLYNTTGSNNTAIGYLAQTPSTTASNQVRIGNTAVTYAGVQVAWTVTSDKRWKSNIQNSNLGLDFINKLHPVSYYRNNDDSKKLEYGFIAQELEATLNNAGVTNNGIISKDDAGMYSVRYNDLLAPMVKAIQEQQLMIIALKKEIEELKKK
jgi:hypothetical protein